MKFIFCAGMYEAKNTNSDASVEFACQGRQILRAAELLCHRRRRGSLVNKLTLTLLANKKTPAAAQQVLVILDTVENPDVNVCGNDCSQCEGNADTHKVPVLYHITFLP